jgi:hypothetical protein
MNTSISSNVRITPVVLFITVVVWQVGNNCLVSMLSGSAALFRQHVAAAQLLAVLHAQPFTVPRCCLAG